MTLALPIVTPIPVSTMMVVSTTPVIEQAWSMPFAVAMCAVAIMLTLAVAILVFSDENTGFELTLEWKHKEK